MATIRDVINRFKRIDAISIPEAMEASHQAVLEFARKQFMTSGQYGGSPWAFYGAEPKYLAYKLALGADPMPLRWTSTMQRLYPALTNPNHPDHKWSNTNGKASLNITIPYLSRIEKGGINQFGETFPGRQVFPKSNGSLVRDVMYDIKKDFYRKLEETGK